jgi:predicted dithiol-disulfide oxidoreductase (DUF899 family)
MDDPRVVSRDEWLAARRKLLVYHFMFDPDWEALMSWLRHHDRYGA